MEKEESKNSPTTRRLFLAAGAVAGGGILLSGLFLIRNSLLFLFPKSPQKRYLKYLVAKVDEIPLGKSKEINMGKKPVFIIHLEQGFKIFSSICPHLGCIVKWKEKDGTFYCPCHKAVFDKDGSVLEGPSPRALDEYGVEVEDSLVFMLIEKR